MRELTRETRVRLHPLLRPQGLVTSSSTGDTEVKGFWAGAQEECLGPQVVHLPLAFMEKVTQPIPL